MRYGKYTLGCRFIDPAILPPFKGSTIRGAFGNALKKAICALRYQKCGDCILKPECLYVRIFETAESPPPAGSKIPTRPHPFVIEPPETNAIHFKSGDQLAFTLLLFGEANQKLPYFIYAFDQMGGAGIGKKFSEGGGRFILETVGHHSGIIYQKSDGVLNPPNAGTCLVLKNSAAYSQPVSKLSIRFLTPLRLKFQNHLTEDLPFHILTRSLLRRVSSLFEAFGGGEPDLPYRELVRKANEIKITHSALDWSEFRRYSSRQNTGMNMGGITGEVVYEGDLTPYMPLVDFCEEIHIGKQTTFGFGKYRAEVIP